MRVAGVSEEVDVTAARSPLALDASASSVRTMTGEQLREAPGYTLDDRLRQVAGFQLFRQNEFVGGESDYGGDDAAGAGVYGGEPYAGADRPGAVE